MNWYKRAQQMSFPFHTPDDEQIQEQNAAERKKKELLSTTDLEELIDGGYIQSEQDLIQALDLQGYEYDKVSDFPEADPIYVVYGPKGPVIIDSSFTDVKNAHEWLIDLSDMELLSYVEQSDSNQEFWEDPPDKLYHGTDSDNLDSIKENGLTPSYGTRSMSNKEMGDAIFTSPTAQEAQEYYDTVVEIDVAQMKQDGYLVPVGREEPLQEEEMRSKLASKIGIDYWSDGYAGEGLSPNTVVFHGAIPPKYLMVTEQ